MHDALWPQINVISYNFLHMAVKDELTSQGTWLRFVNMTDFDGYKKTNIEAIYEAYISNLVVHRNGANKLC